MRKVPLDPDEELERQANERDIDERIARYCHYCGAEMTGTKCPYRCTAGDEEPDAE